MSREDGLKKSHLPRGKESLECRCLRDGSLDCSLETGEVFGVDGKPITTVQNENGYLVFNLNREREARRGKPEIGRNGSRRYRERRKVLVHRLVKMKAVAFGIGGDKWRNFVRDIQRGVDVNHIYGIRTDNRASQLELSTERANRGRQEMTEEETRAVAELAGEEW